MAENEKISQDKLNTEEIFDAQESYAPGSDAYKKELALCKAAGGDVSKILEKKLNYNQLIEVRKGLESHVDVARYMNSSVPWMLMEELRLEMEQKIDMTKYRKEGFTLQQISEIREGLFKGLPVSEYDKKNLLAGQMHEIRLGLENNVPVIFYKDPQFDWMQMQEIRQGLERNMDISLYAKATIPYQKMHVVRESMVDGLSLSSNDIIRYSAPVLEMIHLAYVKKVDISDCVKKDFDADQLEQIIIAREEKINLERYINPEMCGENMQEIRIGIEEGIDVEEYAKADYNWMQMREIRKGLENRVDVKVYAKPLYQAEQMREIRKGLEENLEVERYSSMINTARDMRNIRKRLEAGEDAGMVPKKAQLGEEEPNGQLILELKKTNMDPTKEDLEKEEMHYFKMTPDGLKAILRIPRIRKGTPYTLEFIMDLLKKANVTRGINKEAIEDMIRFEKFEQDTIVAEGAGPKFGKDGYYEFFFDRNIPTQTVFKEDGSADFTKGKYYEEVAVGEKLAFYHKAVQGRDGYTIKGIVLPGKNGRELPMLKGHGFMLMQDRATYCSTVSGAVKLDNNVLNIDRLLVVQPTDMRPQNIDFVGTVCVKGELAPKSVIKARGDVIVDEVAIGTTIESGGDVIFRTGANGTDSRASVKCGGNIYAGYLTNLDIEVKKSIFTNNMLNCRADVDGEVVVYGENGSIVGGLVDSRLGVDTAFLGNDKCTRTTVSIGITSAILNAYTANRRRIDRLENELETLYKEQKRMGDTGTLSSRQQLQWKIKINLAVSMREKELDECRRKKEEIEQTMARIKGAKCRVRNTIYEETVLIVDGMKLNIIDTRTEKGGIVYQR